MKEVRYFYVPKAGECDALPSEEAQHAVRVLRLQPGDEMMLMDGEGTFYKAEVSVASNHHCLYRILETLPQQRPWSGRIHLAIAPTKMLYRMECLLEKAVEVGVDDISFLDCRFSERRQIKLPRMEKIVISAMKQSRKAWKTNLDEMQSFSQFVTAERPGDKFIAHCYEEVERTYLFDELKHLPADTPVTILVGPEGDFSIEEVRQAISQGYKSVHLGKSRLRTETAGLSAVMMAQLSKPYKTD